MTSGGVTAASHECADKVPAGGFIFVPPPEPGQYQFARTPRHPTPPAGSAPSTLCTRSPAKKGDIYITFSGTYNMTDNRAGQSCERVDR